jgi:hypothetical protein
VHGCDGIKPGWARVNFNYFISDTVRDYLIDPHSGQWHHHDGPAAPPLRLADVRLTADGRLSTRATRHHHLGEEALSGQLARAHEVLAARPDRLDDGPTGLPADFERMRWFPLPPACVEQNATAAG